ncbi:hypothetical protein BASA81_006329 [Batrachochytrium salamandrivorans]|nr:hypothetical protein BASA81_006329 [Batrachochytrium salamandrivorans]
MKRQVAGDTLVMMPLGSGQEVGRSSHLLEFKGKKILLDMGIHPGKRGKSALPYLDQVDLASVDILLVSHFHLDHVASLPYLMQKTNFRGRVFMTHPTHAVTGLLLKDFVRVSSVQSHNNSGAGGDTEGLYNENDVKQCLAKCEKIDFHQQIEVDNIKFTAYNAGHVLGACQFLIEIAGVRILYTGDFSREDDRHLMGAECNPDWRPDVLIVEATFGVQQHESQKERERQFIESIDRITKRGGKCLIPIFSFGRAQELLLILDEYWANNPQYQRIPIYHASRLAARSLKVYGNFINAMNDRIRAQNDVANPWDLQHISNLDRGAEDFDEPGPAVVFASPGMLQNGASRKLFEQWCTDSKNGVIVAGYSVEGTLAKEILKGPKEVTTLAGRRVPLNCEVKSVSFTAHSDFPGTYSYIKQLLPRHTILVHGEQGEMKRMHDELERKFAHTDAEMDFCMPQNGEAKEFIFHEERVVKMLGRLADKRQRFENAPVFGFLVSGAFDAKLVAPDELQFFTPLSTTLLSQRLHVPFHSQFERLKAFVGKMFEVVEVESGSGKRQLKVLDEIMLTHIYPPGEVLLEWRASPSNDMLADCIVTILMQSEGGVSGVRISSCFHHHHHHEDHAMDDENIAAQGQGAKGEEEEDALDEGPRSFFQVATLVKQLLEEKFGATATVQILPMTNQLVLTTEDEVVCKLDANTLVCECSDLDVLAEVERCVLNAKRALLPIGGAHFREDGDKRF